MRLHRATALIASAAALGSSCFGSREAHADDRSPQEIRCPLPAGATSALGSHDARRRFSFIRTVVADQAQRAMTWSTAWSFFGVAVAGESFALGVTSPDEKGRIIRLAQGLPAIGFPALILIAPLRVMADDRELHALSEDDPLQAKLCENLARAEKLFAEDAADEKKKTGIFSHALCVLANLASSAVIVIGTGEWATGILNGVSGEAVSEFNLWTLPTGAVSAFERYRSGDLTIPSSAHVISGRGLSVSFSW